MTLALLWHTLLHPALRSFCVDEVVMHRTYEALHARTDPHRAAPAPARLTVPVPYCGSANWQISGLSALRRDPGKKQNRVGVGWMDGWMDAVGVRCGAVRFSG